MQLPQAEAWLIGTLLKCMYRKLEPDWLVPGQSAGTIRWGLIDYYLVKMQLP